MHLEWTSPCKKGARGSESNLFPCVGWKVEQKTARNKNGDKADGH
jgi:hypothetical protein